jgi:hypothetical protein
VNNCRICCCGSHSFHLHLEAGSMEAVADAVVVTAATEAAEQQVKMGTDYVVVHLNLLLCSFHQYLVADVVVVIELETMGRN